MRRPYKCGAWVALFFLLLSATSSKAAIGPVGPSEDVFSKNKKPDDPQEQLPYNISAHENTDNDMAESDNALEFAEDIFAEEKEVIDWSTVPYVPFKRIDLSPAPDPAIE